jgi:hypothetical protein
MTTPTLSDATWRALSHEYRGAKYQSRNSQLEADGNARALGDYLEDHVTIACDIASGGTCLQFHGRDWRVDFDQPDPYSSLDELLADWWTDGDIRVRNITSSHPVWDEHTRYRYQVWHDTGHAETRFDFTRFGELELFQHHALVIRQSDYPAGFHQRVIEGLWAEMMYPLCTAVVHGQYGSVHYLRTPGPVARALLDVLTPR